jgi:RNA polymerase sigma-70 factor (ECF subfamily)
MLSRPGAPFQDAACQFSMIRSPVKMSHMTAADRGRESTDSVLLQRAQKDPESEAAREAACALLSRHRDRVYAWCFHHLGDPERALDAAQEVLLSAYRRLGSFQGRSEFSSWLYVIARNRCLTELRRPHLLMEDGARLEQVRGPEPDPAARYLEGQTEEAILSLIRTHLEPLEQKVLWMRCFEQMPIDGITKALGITEASGARGVLQRARRRLRTALERGGFLSEAWR